MDFELQLASSSRALGAQSCARNFRALGARNWISVVERAHRVRPRVAVFVCAFVCVCACACAPSGGSDDDDPMRARARVCNLSEAKMIARADDNARLRCNLRRVRAHSNQPTRSALVASALSEFGVGCEQAVCGRLTG